jgi:adenosylmethionine-8-amino-7-oxononanoate aminotransferase
LLANLLHPFSVGVYTEVIVAYQQRQKHLHFSHGYLLAGTKPVACHAAVAAAAAVQTGQLPGFDQ